MNTQNKRAARKTMAEETVTIVTSGAYVSPAGKITDISNAVHKCVEGTRYFAAEQMEQLRDSTLALPAHGLKTRIELKNETTLEGIKRMLSEEKSPIAALNFASAKNPGGGFLNGSQAQEESLARSSALYASLLRAGEFYGRHRATVSLLYSDSMIVSPSCPIIRDDDGHLLEIPQLATFITSPAPNAGAMADNRSEELPHVPATLRRRAEYILAFALSQGYGHLVLGAWGCGVFRNDPALVAAAFMDPLRGAWAGRFARVTFSVLDTSQSRETFRAFERMVS